MRQQDPAGGQASCGACHQATMSANHKEAAIACALLAGRCVVQPQSASHCAEQQEEYTAQPCKPARQGVKPNGLSPCRHLEPSDQGCEADRQGLQPSPDGVAPCNRLRLRDIEAPAAASAEKRGAPYCQRVARRGPRRKTGQASLQPGCDAGVASYLHDMPPAAELGQS